VLCCVVGVSGCAGVQAELQAFLSSSSHHHQHHQHHHHHSNQVNRALVRHGLPFGAKAADPKSIETYPFSHDAKVSSTLNPLT